MDWNDLKIFHAVAEQRTLKLAADTLGMSHTTVFRRLKGFEGSVGSRLFDRIQGRYELTETGMRLLIKVRAMSSIANAAAVDVSGDNAIIGGEVVVTAPSSFAYHFLPDYLHELAEQHPEIAVTVLVTSEALDMSARLADVALRVAPSPPDFLVGRKLRSINWAIYGAPTYLERMGKPRNIVEMVGHKLIGASGKLSKQKAFAWLETQKDLKIWTRTDDLTAMAALAAAGHGLALLPDDLCREGLTRCFSFQQSEANSLWILTHPELRHVERIKIVMGFLSKKLKHEKRLQLTVDP